MELKKYKLGDICTFINGRAYLQPELQNSGKYKIVRVGNLSGGNNSWYYSDMELEPTKYCAKGDLLYAWACNFGPYIWKGDKTIYHYHIWKVINSEQIDKMYLYYLLKFMTNSFMGCVHGSTMLHITKENMESMEVRIHASIEEQRRIATILNKLDCKIELNRQINDNLEAMAKQLYDYWFVQFDFPNEEGKPYKSSGGAMVWNDKLKREIPQGWTAAKIKDVAQTYSGGTPTSTNSEYYDGGDIPWINSGELNNPIITSTTNNITEEGLNNSSAKLYPQDTVLVALYGATAGKVSLLSFEACSNQAICGVIPLNKIMTTYIRYYLSSLYEHFITLSSGSARDNISQDTIKNTILPIPQGKILKEFSDAVAPIISKKIANQKEMENLTKQRDELLPLLMNGQATVNYHLSDD